MSSTRNQIDTLRGFGAPMRRPEEWLEGEFLAVPGPLALPGSSDEAWGRILADDQVPAAFVSAWSEKLGCFESGLERIRTALPPSGQLVLSLHNVMAPRNVRGSLQGQLSIFDHRPLMGDRELSFSVEQAVRALSVAGFSVRDLVEVQLWDRQLPLASVKALLRVGIAATRYLVRVPGDRMWIRAERRNPAPGSVLVARHGGDDAAMERTIGALRAFLPSTWEIVQGPVHESECASWNQALTESTGDHVWLLRTGDVPDADSFRRLRHEAPVAPAFLTDRAGEARFGLGGAMFDRAHLLDVGPLPDECASDLVAGEEYLLRSAAFGRAFRPVPASANWQGTAPTPGPRVAELGQELLERWADVDGLDNPGDVAALELPAPPWEAEGREPRISLCMITKNEERFLESCIRRVIDHVDEIVVVDTGSEDRTVEIAESLGAKVLHQPWEGDFSKPRNLSLQHATGDWILVLDADECVSEESAPKLRELVRSRSAAGYHVLFRNDHEEGLTAGVTMVRLFRNLEGIEYRYVIHEQVVMSLMERANEIGLALHPSPLEVVHYGYSDELMDARDKRRRNIELFEKQLDADPDDVYCLYKFADFLRIIGERGDDVKAGFGRALDRLRSQVPSSYRNAPFAGEISALLALQFARGGELEQADTLVREGLQRFLPTPNLHYIAAGIASSLGRSAEAIEQYRSCLSFRDRSLAVPIQPGITGSVSYAGMASCYLQIGDLARAEDWVAASLFEDPNYEVAVLLRTVLDLHAGQLGAALERLTNQIAQGGDSLAMRLQGARILARLQLWEEAGQWFDRAIELSEQEAPLLHREAGMTAMLAEDWERSREHLLAASDEYSRAALELIDRLTGQGGAVEASPEVKRELQSSLQNYGREDWGRLLDVSEETTKPLFAEVRS